MSAIRHLRIGTRGSPMALHQAGLVRDRLITAHPELAVEIVTIRTTGDRVQDRRLAEIGGKGLFTKEIEEALFADLIDLAVHSLKDVESWLPDGLEIACGREVGVCVALPQPAASNASATAAMVRC
jgi:hydroxymethylbilane synthase